MVVSAEDVLAPPPRKVGGPIIDAHTHVGSEEGTGTLLEAAGRYGVRRLLGITSLEAAAVLEQRFPDRFLFAVSLDYNHLDDAGRFRTENLERLRQAHAAGFRVVKFWFKPAFNADTGMFLDDGRLETIFETMAELGMPGLVHIADPDIWFETRYADRALYGTKAQAYEQLEHVLQRHPDVKMMGAHFGGHPEDLDHLARLLDTYPNYLIDTSATKWVCREVGRQPERAREFVIKYAGRILFGSDLVARQGWPAAQYAQRYWVQQMLWEGKGTFRSPIPDGDHQEIIRRRGGDPQAAETPVFHGLALPEGVLERVYYENAAEFLRLGAVPSSEREAE